MSIGLSPLGTRPLGVGIAAESGGPTIHTASLVLASTAELAHSVNSELNATAALSIGAGLAPGISVLFDGAISIDASAALSETSQWIAEEVATFALGIGDEYAYGTTLAADLALGVSTDLEAISERDLGASLNLSASLEQLQSTQINWGGSVLFSCLLDDGRTASGTFNAAVIFDTALDQIGLAGLSLDAQISLGSALSSAIAGAIGQPLSGLYIVEIPADNRIATVAAQLRTFTITR